MGKHILFQLNPWLDNNGEGPFYCPDCGIVEGFLSYSPGVRERIDIRNIDFQRPRQEVIAALGQENQGCPVLVLDQTSQIPLAAKKSMTTGRSFLDDPKAICDFLVKEFKAVRPHP